MTHRTVTEYFCDICLVKIGTFVPRTRTYGHTFPGMHTQRGEKISFDIKIHKKGPVGEPEAADLCTECRDKVIATLIKYPSA